MTKRAHRILRLEEMESRTSPATIWFVDADAVSGANDGMSWRNAFTDLQAALTKASSGDEIWVAEGRYVPTTGTDESISFDLKASVALYGGFAGKETSRTQRAWWRNPTVLSGDIGRSGYRWDNSDHVVKGANKAVLDGFTVCDGVADGITSVARRGGGMYNDHASPIVANCTFANNWADFGAGIYNEAARPKISYCTFRYNEAGRWGGGMYNDDASSPRIDNCSFTGNTSYFGGAAVHSAPCASPVLADCVFSTNMEWTFLPVIGPFSSSSEGRSDASGGGSKGAGKSAEAGGSATALCLEDGAFAGSLMRDGDGDGASRSLFNGRVIYVDIHAIGRVQNGTSWANAYTDLQSALVAALPGDEIWVADGTYLPTQTADRTASFQLKPGVTLYGGFAGAEAFRDARDWRVNVTVLSGDIGVRGVAADNTYHVVRGADGAILDGFTITAGNAAGAGSDGCGGGMLNISASPTVRNCAFVRNAADGDGGALFIGWGASPVLSECFFLDNSAGRDGGAMANMSYSSPALANCVFAGNSCAPDVDELLRKSGLDPNAPNDGTWFGAMYTPGSGAYIRGAIKFMTVGRNYGGAMDNYDHCSPVLSSCTFTGNAAAYGGAMANRAASSPMLTNCILWGDEAIQPFALDGDEVYNTNSRAAFRNCDIYGANGSGARWNARLGTDGGGNIEVNPAF